MDIKIDDILNREVSRKEFLAIAATAIISAIGVSSMIKNISGTFSKKGANSSSLNYGGDVYGGTKNDNLSN